MKALILVGGYGTRLRPLTFSKPKPLVEFCNRPMILHQIHALAQVGVTEIILAVNYQPEAMVEAMNRVSQEFNVKITFSIEDEPLGTAGPLGLARDILSHDDSPFFVLNSDVICQFPFKELLEFHLNHKRQGTIMTTRVDDPSKYGVVVMQPGTTLVDRFVEKPQEFVGDQINAGIYIFNPSMLGRIGEGPLSIEQQVFPKMAKDNELHCIPLEGFWADVGQPKDFLVGTALYLDSLKRKESKVLKEAKDLKDGVNGISLNGKSTLSNALASGQGIVGNVLIHPSAKLGNGCKIGPNVVIGQDAVIGDGVRLVDSVVMQNAVLKDYSWVKKSIVGWYSTVGRWARLDNVTVLGEDVHVKDEVFTNGATVLPHKVFYLISL